MKKAFISASVYSTLQELHAKVKYGNNIDNVRINFFISNRLNNTKPAKAIRQKTKINRLSKHNF